MRRQRVELMGEVVGYLVVLHEVEHAAWVINFSSLCDGLLLFGWCLLFFVDG
jgi:hypothetical protein